MKNFLQALFTILLGVIVPAAALIYEGVTHQCAQTFFDPIPTVAHIVLVALVPITNLALWWTLKHGNPRHLATLSKLNALTIGIALFYSIVFLPLVPIGIIGVSVLLGFLPLAPLCSLIIAVLLRRSLNRSVTASKAVRSNTRALIVLGFGLLITLEVPAIVTQVGLQMAAASDPIERVRGVKLLRFAGDETVLLRKCYVRSGRMVDLLSVLLWLYRPVSTDDARDIFYRVTGEAYNSKPPPTNLGFAAFDRYQGGDIVGQRLNVLQLQRSELNVSIDADALLAYMEWTMVVKNRSPRLGEARMQLALPAGAVVSRLTLWINGEEREAAFGPRKQVRDAYKKVVQRQRDPVLVTTSGPDAVMIQMFPVPANGGEMQIRVGITAPLEVSDLKTGRLRLPQIRERNFDIPKTILHSLRAESAHVLDSPAVGMRTLRGDGGTFVLESDSAKWLVDGSPLSIHAERDAKVRRVWATDTHSDPNAVVTQTIEPFRFRINHIVLVIDASHLMASHQSTIVNALKHIPASFGLSMIIAGDEVVELATTSANAIEDLSLALADTAFEGGIDNTLAIARAVEVAARYEHGAVLWLHGPQDLSIDKTSSRPTQNGVNGDVAPIYAIQFAQGPNRLKELFGAREGFHVVPIYSDGAAAIGRLFRQWSGSLKNYQLVRASMPAQYESEGALQLGNASKTSFHLVRLMAYDSVLKLLTGDEGSRERATALAMDYQLVTPVTGAVVLETKAQYDEAGLQPTDRARVPTVPEPAVWMLLVCALVCLPTLFRQSRGTRHG